MDVGFTGPDPSHNSRDMHSLYFIYIGSLFALPLFATCSHSRHIHHRAVHRHLHRAATPTSSSPALPSNTATSTIITDLRDIQQGLSTLREDILKLIPDLQQRLKQIEDLLAGLIVGSEPLPAQLSIPASSISISEMGQTISSIASAAAASSTVSLDLCAGSQGIGFGPCPSTYPTSTLTSTSTATDTITRFEPLPSGRLVHPSYGNASYIFDPDARDNVAVYYGQSPATKPGGLLKLCQSPNVDIVILAFVNDFFSAEGYPGVDFGAACYPASVAQTKKAPGLLDCSKLGPEITGCQAIGKPVLVSLGGYIANTTFVSLEQTTQFAIKLWNLFGAGREDPDIRPFGKDAIVDGFDIDNENHNTTFYDAFATALRKQMGADPSKPYYLSAAPQCPIPDESIPLGAMHQADFVWTQFYNNPSCNLNSTGFAASFEAWSRQLKKSTLKKKPRLYIGGGAFADAGTGYVPGAELKGHIEKAKQLNASNLGGIMLWDGSEGMANIDRHGKNYLYYAKHALE